MTLECRELRPLPRLSVVVTSRNDNHGEGMLTRFQHFLDCLCDQSRRTGGVEIIVVEWNPPADRPSLREQLNWENVHSGIDIRFVEVPPELHNSLPFNSKIPLYQYPAKNVGIRRARGEFILSTNLDILLSNPLFDRIMDHPLDERTVYRADRVDVGSSVPPSPKAKDKLEYCEANTLRAFRQWGLIEGPSANSQDVPKGFESNRLVGGSSLTAQSFIHAWKSYWSEVSALMVEYWRSTLDFIRKPTPLTLKEIGLRLACRQPWSQATFRFRRYPQLHTGASGDFILMSRKAWHELNGHPDIPIHAMYLDGATLYEALGRGMKLENFPAEMPAYHIEHAGGWTPQVHDAYFTRLSSNRIPFIPKSVYARWAEAFYRRKKTPNLLKNRSRWGFGDKTLKSSSLLERV